MPLLLAFELGQRWWKIGTTTGVSQRPRLRRIAAGDVAAVQAENRAGPSESGPAGRRAGGLLL